MRLSSFTRLEGGARLESLDYLARYIAEFDGGKMNRHLSALETGQLEQFVHHGSHALDVRFDP